MSLRRNWIGLAVLLGLSTGLTPALASTPKAIDRLTPQAVQQLAASHHRVLVVDVRSPEDYRDLHVKGAISLPLSAILKDQPHLSDDQEIVFYCTCHHEEAATEAATLMRDRYGFSQTAVLIGGLGAWTTAKLPIDPAKD